MIEILIFSFRLKKTKIRKVRSHKKRQTRNNKQETTNKKQLNIGVITPYRAQIAQIRSVLEEKGIDPTGITIDTVERYQGGARDIILISLCTNTIYQLEALSAHSDEGIDRKLNVALTRAREHVIILGNPILLQENDVYRALMDNVQAATTP